MELTPSFRDSEVWIPVAKMWEFCNAAYLISRHSERVFPTPLSPAKANRILTACQNIVVLTFFRYASVIVCSAFTDIFQKRHVDVPVELRFLRGCEAGEMQLPSTVSSQCLDSTPFTSIDRQN